MGLNVKILGVEFENPFLLASAPPSASIEGIDKAFEMGWGGAVLKTITPDDLEMYEASPRYAVIKENNKVIGLQNIELLSHETVEYWVRGIKYLKENMIVQVLMHDSRIIGVDLPAHVILEVTDTPPSEKGNTAQGGTKPATLETGAVVNVPFFISNGDKIRVDTRTNEYLDRA